MPNALRWLGVFLIAISVIVIVVMAIWSSDSQRFEILSYLPALPFGIAGVCFVLAANKGADGPALGYIGLTSAVFLLFGGTVVTVSAIISMENLDAVAGIIFGSLFVIIGYLIARYGAVGQPRAPATGPGSRYAEENPEAFRERYLRIEADGAPRNGWIVPAIIFLSALAYSQFMAAITWKQPEFWLFTAGLILLTLIPVWILVRRSLHKRRFAHPHFAVPSVPAFLDKTLIGEIETGVRLPEHLDVPFTLRLMCDDLYHVRSGGQSAWVHEATITGTMGKGEQGILLPVSIDLPEDRGLATSTVPGLGHRWSMKVTADLAGLDFSAIFPLYVAAPE